MSLIIRAGALAAVVLLLGVAHAGAQPRLLAVGAENEYADVIAQVGGRDVSVTAIESNPNTDPHSFEASPSVARTIGRAALVVQNGLGYDSYMDNIESASPSRTRRVIDVQTLLRLPNSTSNPHLWYSPATMPKVADAVAADLAAIRPADAGYFRANAAAFIRSLGPWRSALAAFAKRHPATPVAVTEPVADYLLSAAGARILTPFTFQAAVMNGTDPAPQDVALEQSLLQGHRVKLFVYNRQVTDTLTKSFLADAAHGHVPVVGVYETMPAGYHYQGWMLATVETMSKALG
jgi:zinc/manganese transport system substrate-binding protein